MADENLRHYEWRVTGMDCGSCAAKVRGAVGRLPGVSDVDIALMAERLRLTLDEGETLPAQVETAVRAVGFGIAPKGAAPERPEGGFVLPNEAFADMVQEDDVCDETAGQPAGPGGTSWYQTSKGRLVIGTGGLLAVAAASHLIMPTHVSKWAFILATLIGLAPITRRAVAMLRTGMPFTIEMLMTIAATGALVIGEAEEAALVVFLFAVREMLEGLSANKAREGIRALSRLVPKVALLETGGACGSWSCPRFTGHSGGCGLSCELPPSRSLSLM